MYIHTWLLIRISDFVLYKKFHWTPNIANFENNTFHQAKISYFLSYVSSYLICSTYIKKNGLSSFKSYFILIRENCWLPDQKSSERTDYLSFLLLLTFNNSEIVFSFSLYLDDDRFSTWIFGAWITQKETLSKFIIYFLTGCFENWE